MLKTLEGLEKINDVKIMTNEDRPLNKDGSVDWEKFDKMRKDFPICIDHKTDMVSFKLMTKPASEGGSGCQHVDMIGVAKHILEYFTEEGKLKLEGLKEVLEKGKKKGFESLEESEKLRELYNNTLTSYNCNVQTCLALSGALHHQMVRTADRERREVEGTSKA